MKIKLKDRTEYLISQAVALDQSGMMKNTVFGFSEFLFIVNFDDTILLRFMMDEKIPEALAFFANDYESNEMEVSGGKVTFITCSGGYRRRKECAAPKRTWNEVAAIWSRFRPVKDFPLNFNTKVLSHLDDDLSHVEIHNANGKARLIQKNIYSGAKVEIDNADGGLFAIENFPEGFQPVGLRTVDFKALFTMTDALTFNLQPGHNWVYVTDPFDKVNAILSTCLYDELGFVAEVK
jgi:hypothetical protein